MSAAFWAELEASREGVIEARRPRLMIPALNAMCKTKQEYDDAIGEQWHAKEMEMAAYRPARETNFQDITTLSTQIDNEATAAIRFWIYRHGAIDLEQMSENIENWWGKTHYRNEQRLCAGIERHASLLGRNAVYVFVARSIQRTGGLQQWRTRSRFQDRHDCWEASYDELPEYCDLQVYHEEGRSISIRNTHALDTNPATMDVTDPRHAYREFNKVRFLHNCEATYHFLFDGPDGEPCVWATRMAWMTSARIPQVKAIKGLPEDARDVPGRPFGQEEDDQDRERARLSMGPAPVRIKSKFF